MTKIGDNSIKVLVYKKEPDTFPKVVLEHQPHYRSLEDILTELDMVCLTPEKRKSLEDYLLRISDRDMPDEEHHAIVVIQAFLDKIGECRPGLISR